MKGLLIKRKTYWPQNDIKNFKAEFRLKLMRNLTARFCEEEVSSTTEAELKPMCISLVSYEEILTYFED